MTDEEALQELLRDSDGPCVLWMREGFAAGLRHARQWRDGLPGPHVPVLGYDATAATWHIAVCDQHGEWQGEEGTWPRITHWLPLPEAP